MRNLILAIMAGVTFTHVAAWGSDDPMLECTKRLRPIQEQTHEQKKLAGQLGGRIDEIGRKEQEETSEKALQEEPHDYKSKLIKSWMGIEGDFDRLDQQLKDINFALENITAWAAENQVQECIKMVHDEQQAVQKIEQQADAMIDGMRDNFIRRLEKLKQNGVKPPQQTQHGADWILWVRSSTINLSDHNGPKESWDIVAAFGSKTDCVEESKKKLREIEKDGFKSQAGYSTAFKADKGGVVLTVQYICSPDTEDPRGEKGKER
jgi:hypothetical protein